jgi:diacylglycerol kinase (ATP)
VRFHFVVNPVAGRRTALSIADAIAARLEARGHSTSRHVTSGPGDARAHVAAGAVPATDRLVVVGGDGTLREVINGAPPPLPWPVGIVPVGTANLVGREARMPLSRDPDALVEALVAAEPWTTDLLELARAGEAPERAAANVGAGLDAEIVHAAAHEREAHAGLGGYARWVKPIWGTFRAFDFSRIEATVDGRRTYRGSGIVVQNARSYGGLFTLAPEARMDSGLLDVTVIRCRTHRDLFRILLGAWLGRLTQHKDVAFVRGTEVSIRAARPLALQADGDPAGHTDVVVRVLPGALRLLRAPA